MFHVDMDSLSEIVLYIVNVVYTYTDDKLFILIVYIYLMTNSTSV
jgi:hypothetical protein